MIFLTVTNKTANSVSRIPSRDILVYFTFLTYLCGTVMRYGFVPLNFCCLILPTIIYKVIGGVM